MSVRSDIETRLRTWAAEQTPKLPVEFENVAFNKPTTTGYLQIFFLVKDTVNADVSAESERETGMFQINVCMLQGKGTKDTETAIEGLKAAFPVLPKTNPVSIERPPTQSGGYNRDDGFYITALTFSYRRIA